MRDGVSAIGAWTIRGASTSPASIRTGATAVQRRQPGRAQALAGTQARRPPAERTRLKIATKVNDVFSKDFVRDSLASSRRLICMNVADEFSHEAVDIAVDYGISGQYVARVPNQAALFHGFPAAVRTDNCPEFTCRVFFAWAQGHGIRHILIGPVRPMQNGYIESCKGRFRYECLNKHWFETLHQAWTEIARWRRDYNEVRPHGSIGRMHHQHDSPSSIAGVPAMLLGTFPCEQRQPVIFNPKTPAETLVRRMGAGKRRNLEWPDNSSPNEARKKLSDRQSQRIIELTKSAPS